MPRWLLRGIALAGIAALAVIGFHEYRTQDPAPSDEYWMSPAENLTGDEPLGRALANLSETTNTRVKQIAHALNEIFLGLPEQERVAATIRLGDSRALFAGVPIDHYLFEWMPPIDDATAAGSKLQLEVKPVAVGERSTHQGVTVRLTRDKKRLIVTTTLLVGTAAESCERALQEGEVLAGTNVSLVPIVDTVASCILMHHLRARVAYMATFTKKPSGTIQKVGKAIHRIGTPTRGQATLFVTIFDPVLALGDSSRQRELLVGLERYHFYAKNWTKQPGDAQAALEEAVARIHLAVGGDDADAHTPRYPLAEYLYVHAATTLVMGPPEPGRRPNEQRGQREHLSLHVDRAFRVWPYECARWAKAVTLQAAGRPSEAQTAWKAVGDDPTPRCARPEGGGRTGHRDTHRRGLAKARVAAVYAAIGDSVKALKSRVQDGQLRSANPSGAPSSSASGAGGAAASPKSTERHTPALETAAELFESALDAVQLSAHAANVRELLPLAKGAVRFVEEDMANVREAVGPIVAISARDDGELAKARVALDAALARCRAATGDCDALRDAARGLVEQLMEAANDVAVQRLEAAARLLEAERDRLCRNEAAKLGECEGTIAGTSAPADDDGGEGDDTQRADARATLRQVSDTWVRVLMTLVYQQCHAPRWVAPATIGLDATEIAKRTEDVLRRSPLAPTMASFVGECALTIAAAATPAGERLIKTHRGTHAADAWPWAPPPAEGAFRIEKELRNRALDDFPQAHPALALFRYATLWDAISAYAGMRAENPSKDVFADTTRSAIRAYVSDVGWTPRRDLVSLWDGEIGEATALRGAMGAVGSALYRELQRKQHQGLPLACLDVLALRACDASAPPRGADVPEECASAGTPACLLDDARSSYEQWAGTRLRPGALPEVQAVMQEGARRAALDRGRFVQLLDAGVKVLLTRFAVEAKNGLDDARVRLGVLRLAARLRSLPGGAVPDELSLLSLAAFEKIVTGATKPQQRRKTQMLAIAGDADPVHALARTGVAFAESGQGRAVLHLSQAEQAIDARPAASRGCWGGDASTKSRWTRRFFQHVALNLETYTLETPADRRGPAVDLVAAYDAWCNWGALGDAPLLVDEEVLALSWMWQGDDPERDRSTVLNGDDLPAYLRARVLLHEGDAKDAVEIARRLADGEGRLLLARAAVQLEQPGEALDAAAKAEQLLKHRTVHVVDAGVSIVNGDARLLYAVKASPQGWGEFLLAARAYEKGAGEAAALDVGSIVRLRHAAALLEVRRFDDVIETLTPLSAGPCRKARLLLAVARWARGEQDTARALATRAGVEFADLPRAIEATSCKDGAAPIFVGENTMRLGRTILTERSALSGSAPPQGQTSPFDPE